MAHLTGTFETPNAPKYLQQLCKHFAHKVEATCDPTSGFAALGFGPTYFEADNAVLSIKIALHDGADPLSAQQMIDAHLERFAFREAFKTMVWSES